jgi:hypothetical protein
MKQDTISWIVKKLFIILIVMIFYYIQSPAAWGLRLLLGPLPASWVLCQLLKAPCTTSCYGATSAVRAYIYNRQLLGALCQPLGAFASLLGPSPASGGGLTAAPGRCQPLGASKSCLGRVLTARALNQLLGASASLLGPLPSS